MNPLVMKLAALNSQKTMIGAVIATAIYWLFFFDGGSAMKAQADKLASDLTAAKSAAEKADRALKEVDDLRKMVSGLGEQFKLATQKLPTELSMSDVITTVDSLARMSGVSIKNKQPSTERNDASKGLVEVIPLRVGIDSGFSETVLFMYYISITERITRIGDFSLRLATGEGAKRLEATIDVLSYKFVGEGNRTAEKGSSQ